MANFDMNVKTYDQLNPLRKTNKSDSKQLPLKPKPPINTKIKNRIMMESVQPNKGESCQKYQNTPKLKREETGSKTIAAYIEFEPTVDQETTQELRLNERNQDTPQLPREETGLSEPIAYFTTVHRVDQEEVQASRLNVRYQNNRKGEREEPGSEPIASVKFEHRVDQGVAQEEPRQDVYAYAYADNRTDNGNYETPQVDQNKTYHVYADIKDIPSATCSRKMTLICCASFAIAALIIGVVVLIKVIPPATTASTSSRDSIYGEWSGCTRTCGAGVRLRACSNSSSTDKRCTEFNPEMIQDCDAGQCPQDPQWTTWLPWSNCTVTCDGGFQTRFRTCNDAISDTVLNDVKSCVGEEMETKECNMWDCPCCLPACTTPCAQGSTRNASSCVCECGTQVLNGTVTDGNNRPLEGATVYRAERPDLQLATSGSDGKFSITRVCSQTNMIVRKSMFTTFTGKTVRNDSDLTSSSIRAVIEKMELPFITDHPVSKVRGEGEGVAFCCTATSHPAPTKYEWFKNDYIITAENGKTLIKTNLRKTDAGLYRCRVHNEAGMIFSDPSELTVTGHLISLLSVTLAFSTCSNIIFVPVGIGLYAVRLLIIKY